MLPLPACHVHGSRTENTVFTAHAQYKEREFAADVIPICPELDFVIHGDAGLVCCTMLDDRIHALAVDTLGGVAVLFGQYQSRTSDHPLDGKMP